MTLSPGSWLGTCEILGHLGSGGMGEVYRARDNKLNREVAVKVLPEQFARDPERVARFRREAQLLAQLNHPNIAAIYNLEESAETRFLVMELVPGETLRERIKRGPVPVEEALAIAKQIAEALEAAHEKPIIHRDLKPANVKVTPQGRVKVLDFGLAKAFAGADKPTDPADIPTGSQHGTLAGTILGTPAYMSPEQARGKQTDKRTDIWSFGCVLYELLTGQWVFSPNQSRERERPGVSPTPHSPLATPPPPPDSIADILGAVLHKEPDWTALPPETPPGIRNLLRRCLEKDASRRLRDAADVQIQIEDAQASSVASPETKPAPPVPLWRRALPYVLTGIAAAAIAVGITMWNRPETPVSQPVSRFTLPLQDRIQGAPWLSTAISPDGSRVVYTGAGAGGQFQLYLRSLESPQATPIPGTQGGTGPFFSPDGQWLGFFDFASGKLMKVALSGGPALTLCDARGAQVAATWGPDDTIVFSAYNAERRPTLFRVPAAGGTPVVLTQPDSAKGETAHAWPEFLPGGKTLLFAIAANNDWDNAQIVALNLESGERRVLVQGGTYPRYAPTGHLVYHRAGTMMAVPFNPDRLEVTGAPAPVLEGVMSSGTTSVSPTGSGVAQFSFSRTGSLVYVAGLREAERTLAWLDRKGAVEPLGAPPRAYRRPTLSPDGTKVAVNIEGQTNDIWIYDLARGTLTRLTFEGNNLGHVWTADGKRIVFTSIRGGSRHLFSKLADGAGAEEQLSNERLLQNINSISRDGKLAFVALNPGGENDLATIELQGEKRTTIFLKTPFDEGGAVISPDGRWVAYTSNESGRQEVYVRAFPGPEGKWQISTEGAAARVWARNGRELFYVSDNNKLMVVDVTTEPTFQPGTPRVLLEGPFLWSVGLGTNYDVSPDGQRFLVIQDSAANSTQLNVVLNWFEELKQRVPLP